MRHCWCILLLWGMLLVPHVAWAQERQPELRTYESWIREAFAAAQRGDRLGLEQVAPKLITTQAVRATDGTALPVNNDWLRTALAPPDPNLPEIAQRLHALLDALSPPPSAAPADARQRLQEILNNPPFASPVRDDLLSRFIDWLIRQLERLFGVGDSVGAGPANVLGWLLAMVGAVLIVGVLIYFAQGMRRSLASDAQATAEDDPDANLTAAAALQQAQQLARGGDYRTGVRYLYLSTLLWLDERGVLRYDRALTNREYLERLSNQHELQTHLRPIVETFDRVWYGYDVLDAERFAAYERQVADLRRVRIAAE